MIRRKKDRAILVKDNELKVNDVSKLYQYIKNKIPDLN